VLGGATDVEAGVFGVSLGSLDGVAGARQADKASTRRTSESFRIIVSVVAVRDRPG
jgi:N-acyl-D-aspartate/D-glutamate deacylase